MTAMSIDGESLCRTVTAAQQGNRTAADQLVRDHEAWVRSAIYGVTGRPDLVDDIAQQVWARVWERLSTLQRPTRLRAWLYSIARNAAIDLSIAHRRQRDRCVRLDDRTANQAVDQRPARPAAMDAETQQTLLQAVQALPAIYREPFVLRHLEDWSYAQIGEVLELPVDTVETRLVRARRLLRENLAGKV